MTWLVILTAVISSVYAEEVISKCGGFCGEPLKPYQPGDRYFYFPSDDDSNVLHQIDRQEKVNQQLLVRYAVVGQTMNQYLLYTRSNPDSPQNLVYGDVFRLITSRYNRRRDTVILVHGWDTSGNSRMSLSLKEAFLEAGDVNVIVVGWSAIARNNYATAKTGATIVGRHVGAFISWLVVLGTSYDRIHCVGYSMGAHVIGAAGRATRSRVRRITALDPAWPLWEDDKNRLSSTDAKYVEVIHTSILLLGYPHPCGHADFYPNGGKLMNGCVGPICSHIRSHEYMYTSVKYNHLLAKKCATVKQATSNSDTCCGKAYLMGNSDLNKNKTGIFRVNTLSSYPY